MKEFLSKHAGFISAWIPLLHAVLLVVIMFKVFQVEKKLTQVKEDVGCEYFINVEEWIGGSLSVYSTSTNSVSLPQVELEYKEQIQSESINTCSSTGACLDSARVTLYRDCPDNILVDVLRDSLITF